MSLTNKILVVVVVLAIAFAILFTIAANNSKGSNLPVSPAGQSVAKKTAKVVQLKNMLHNTISYAISAGVQVSCRSVSECLKGLPNNPQTSTDLDNVINRLENMNNSLNDKLNSPCLQGRSGLRAAYNRLLYQIADRTESLHIDPMLHPEIYTDKVKVCTSGRGLKCANDYENCIEILQTALDELSKVKPTPPAGRSPTPSKVPSPFIPIPKLTENYTKIVDVTDKKSLSKFFLLDDPSGKGEDPTGGINDYSYPFIRDEKYTQNPFFQSITKDTRLISDVAGSISGRSQGLRIGIAPDMTWNWSANKPGFALSAGSTRLMTQKFFKGGLFIIDVRHAPMGCAIWPSLWLNAFVGEKDQFHLDKDQDGYDESMKKLLDTYVSKEEYNPLTCKKDETLVSIKTKSPVPRNEELSKYANKDIYVAAWPAGGEIDILENVSFGKQNMISIHGGAMCELSDGNNNSYTYECNNCPKGMKARSVCTLSSFDGYGPYSGCGAQINKMDGKVVEVPHTNDKRFSCLASATSSDFGQNDAKDGNNQVLGPDGSFVIEFNENGGGVYACEWIPMERINIWLFPHNSYSMQELKESEMPLSNNPNPDSWPKTHKSNSQTEKTLIASYLIGEKGTLKEGCDFNYMSLIINIAIGGGFGGGTMPQYCKSQVLEDNQTYKNIPEKNRRILQANEYIKHCYNADPNAPGGGKTGPLGDGKDYLPGLPLPQTPLPTELQCYDGANESGRDGKSYFYKSAYFDIDSIRIFQKKNMDSVF